MSKALAISNLITLNEVIKPYGKYLVEKIRTEELFIFKWTDKKGFFAFSLTLQVDGTITLQNGRPLTVIGHYRTLQEAIPHMPSTASLQAELNKECNKLVINLEEIDSLTESASLRCAEKMDGGKLKRIADAALEEGSTVSWFSNYIPEGVDYLLYITDEIDHLYSGRYIYAKYGNEGIREAILDNGGSELEWGDLIYKESEEIKEPVDTTYVPETESMLRKMIFKESKTLSIDEILTAVNNYFNQAGRFTFTCGMVDDLGELIEDCARIAVASPNGYWETYILAIADDKLHISLANRSEGKQYIIKIIPESLISLGVLGCQYDNLPAILHIFSESYLAKFSPNTGRRQYDSLWSFDFNQKVEEIKNRKVISGEKFFSVAERLFSVLSEEGKDHMEVMSRRTEAFSRLLKDFDLSIPGPYAVIIIQNELETLPIGDINCFLLANLLVTVHPNCRFDRVPTGMIVKPIK